MALICLSVVGVDLVDLRTNFENFGGFGAPVPGLIVSLGSYVDLGQKGLDITLNLYGHKTSLEVLSKGHLLVYVSLTWCLRASYTA